MDLLLNLYSVSRLQIFLNLHSQNVRIDGQLQLLRHLVHLSLLHIEKTPLLRESALQGSLCFLAELELVPKSLLILRQLRLDLLVMAAKILMELAQFLLLLYRI